MGPKRAVPAPGPGIACRDRHGLPRAVSLAGQLFSQKIHEQAVVPAAVRSPFGGAQDADGPEPHLGVAADGGRVVGRRVDLQPVMAVVDDEVPGQRPDCIGANTAELPVLRSSRTLVRGTEPNPQLEPEH
jgi:hypothetical protein